MGIHQYDEDATCMNSVCPFLHASMPGQTPRAPAGRTSRLRTPAKVAGLSPARATPPTSTTGRPATAASTPMYEPKSTTTSAMPTPRATTPWSGQPTSAPRARTAASAPRRTRTAARPSCAVTRVETMLSNDHVCGNRANLRARTLSRRRRAGPSELTGLTATSASTPRQPSACGACGVRPVQNGLWSTLDNTRKCVEFASAAPAATPASTVNATAISATAATPAAAATRARTRSLARAGSCATPEPSSQIRTTAPASSTQLTSRGTMAATPRPGTTRAARPGPTTSTTPTFAARAPSRSTTVGPGALPLATRAVCPVLHATVPSTWLRTDASNRVGDVNAMNRFVHLNTGNNDGPTYSASSNSMASVTEHCIHRCVRRCMRRATWRYPPLAMWALRSCPALRGPHAEARCGVRRRLQGRRCTAFGDAPGAARTAHRGTL